jgi:hypothetical protein
MLKLEVIIHDSEWPKMVITVNRESYAQGQITTQEKIQYDLCYDKAEVMVHNQLRPMVNELIARRKRGQTTHDVVQT